MLLELARLIKEGRARQSLLAPWVVFGSDEWEDAVSQKESDFVICVMYF